MTMELSSVISPNYSASPLSQTKSVDRTSNSPTPKPRIRRSRYTARACAECRRRKVKCSGSDPCHGCSTNDASCVYIPLPNGDKQQAAAKRGHRRGNEQDHVTKGRRRRIDESSLLNRLGRLEEELNQLKSKSQSEESVRMHDGHISCQLDCDKPPGAQDSTSGSSSDIISGIDDENQVRGQGQLSFSMQVQKLKGANGHVPPIPNPPAINSAGRTSFPSLGFPSVEKQNAGGRETIACTLEHNDRLVYLLRLFFDEFNFSWVAVDLSEFTSQLSTLLEEYGSPSKSGLLIPVEKAESIALAALACIVMAIAEFLDADDPRIRRDSAWYSESQRLLAHYPKFKSPNFDHVRYHLLEAYYNLCIEQTSESSSAMAAAVNVAFVTGLNDEDLWGESSEAEKESRRALWWTVYLMDRQVARLFGRPYFIHDAEVAVDGFIGDFSDKADSRASSSPETSSMAEYDAKAKEVERDALRLLDPPPVGLEYEDWYGYMQFSVKWGRLFTRAWDAFFSVRASKKGDTEEVESMDALLSKLKRTLPPRLVWETPCLPRYIELGESDQKLRVKLIMFMRINLLRLSILHSSLLRERDSKSDLKTDDADRLYTMNVCQNLASETLEAIAEYKTRQNTQRPFSTFATMGMIECIYHLVSLPHDAHSTSTAASCAHAIVSVSKALQSLKSMAQSNIRIAQNALKVLQGVISAGRDGICRCHQHRITKLSKDSPEAMQMEGNQLPGFGDPGSEDNNYMANRVDSGDPTPEFITGNDHNRPSQLDPSFDSIDAVMNESQDLVESSWPFGQTWADSNGAKLGLSWRDSMGDDMLGPLFNYSGAIIDNGFGQSWILNDAG